MDVKLDDEGKTCKRNVQIILVGEVAAFSALFFFAITGKDASKTIGHPLFIEFWGFIAILCLFTIVYVETKWKKLCMVGAIAFGNAAFVCGSIIYSPFVFGPFLLAVISIPFFVGFRPNQKLSEEIIPNQTDKSDYIAAFISLYSAYAVYYFTAFSIF